MAVQTVYPSTMPAAVAGAKATEIPATIISRTVVDTGSIGFGIAVAQGDEDKTVKPFGTGSTKFVGITLLDRSANGISANKDSFAEGDSARVMTIGDIWVKASVAVSAGDPVYLVAASGAFTNVSTGNTLVPNARFDTSTTAANQLAVVRLS